MLFYIISWGIEFWKDYWGEQETKHKGEQDEQ